MSLRQSNGPLALTQGQLERALTLAQRAHDGTVHLEEVERDGLPWVRIHVLLTDMGDVPPLHIFDMNPRGALRP